MLFLQAALGTLTGLDVRDLKVTNTLPDPENHRFFTDSEPEPKEHWLVRLWEWTVSKWLPKYN
jgi:hypothetical protein